MNILENSMRSTAILLTFIFLAACTPDKPVITFPSLVPPNITPTRTAEITTGRASPGTPSPIATEDCTRGDYFDQIESNGQARQYLLHVPPAYKPEEPAALVLVFHGAGIGAERFVDYSRFSNVADREGFLIVYPEGLDEVWNPSPGSRDVQFISDLIDYIQRRCQVDPDRIYASGHSNGGGMVHRLACDLADRISAIGTISGAYQSSGQCSPSRPVPVFAIHGTADNIIPYEGIPHWAADWAGRNDCDPEPAEIPHNVLIQETKWSSCREGADVILYTIQDLGHDWTHDLINMGQTIWDFFKAHPRVGIP
jgi:polyhydroxybutyrate depolymerase